MKTKKEYKQNAAGFTLIELLVVISIISLISSVALVSFNNARIKARDARRLADAKQLRTAIELYSADNGHYPITWCSGAGSSPYANIGWTCLDCQRPDVLDNKVCDAPNGPVSNLGFNEAMDKYIKTPKDPKYTSDPESGYWYASADGKDFNILSWVTPENMNNFDVTVIQPRYCALPILSNGDCSPDNAYTYGSIHAIGFWAGAGIDY